MPSRERHLSQANGNERFLGTFDLKQTPYPDWAITVAFYAAVHWVEAYFAEQNQHFDYHPHRNTRVGVDLPGIAANYMLLYSESRVARYDCTQITNAAAQLAAGFALPAVRRGVEAHLP